MILFKRNVKIMVDINLAIKLLLTNFKDIYNAIKLVIHSGIKHIHK